MRSRVLPQPTGSIDQGLRRVTGSKDSVKQGGTKNVNEGLLD